MPRYLSVRLALVSLALPTAVTLAACGHSSSHASSSSRSSSSSSSSASSSSGICAAGFTAAKIAGQPRCLQDGQQCQQENSSDYKKYGFECTKNNGRHELRKK